MQEDGGQFVQREQIGELGENTNKLQYKPGIWAEGRVCCGKKQGLGSFSYLGVQGVPPHPHTAIWAPKS